MAAHRTEAKLRVDGLAVSSGDGATRIEMPRAELAELSGHAGRLEYRATGLTFDQLHGRFGPLYWNAEAATAGGVTLRDPDGRFTLTCGAVELPRGIAMSRAAGGGIELVAATATLTDVRLHLPDLRALRRAPSEAPAPPPTTEPRPLRQERLRFLDAVKGALGFRLKIALDLPVIGKRTLDQPVRVDIADGAFDYRALDDGLTWLEGAFLDLGVSDQRFKVGWSVPMFASKEIISWVLAPDAQALAIFNRIPLRVLADVRLGGRSEVKPKPEAQRSDGKPSRLRSLTLADIDIGLSMVAPRSVEVGGGTILFGGEDAPGLLDLRVAGALVHPPAPGVIKGRIGALDLTLKDVNAGGVAITADRLHLEAIEQVELTFDGFSPTALTIELRSVTATNLALILG